MKPLFFAFFICLLTSPCFSQISLSIGPSLPVGEFASKNGSDPASGMAKPGALADLSYMSPPKAHLGLIGTIRWRVNPVSKDGALGIFQQAYPSFQWSMSSHSWSAGAVMAGVYYTASVTPKLSFQGALMAGAAEVYAQDWAIRGIRDSTATGGHVDVGFADNKKMHTTTFTAMAKAGISYRLTGRLSFVASLDYWYLKPAFKNFSTSLAFGYHMLIPGYYSLSNSATAITYNSYTKDYTQPMNSLDLTAGLSFRL
jgi:hypothetical protein